MNERIVLGAMSGTSADGVDVAAVGVSGRGLGMTAKYLHHVERPYDAALRRRIFAVRESGAVRLDELASLGRAITLAYAAATRDLLEEMSLSPAKVAAVAAHGQTLYHAPPNTIQWLDPSLLAAETDLQVVSDFRRADLAAGGQGAPLVPFADWILFRHATKTRVILNLGGIANLTYLPAGGGIEEVVAFDTGPGCCVSDWLMRTFDPTGESFDRDGIRAARGRKGAPRLDVSKEPFLRKVPPKSTDVPEMIEMFKRICGQHGDTKFDRLDEAMLDHLISVSVDVVLQFLWRSLDWLGGCDEMILCGGGARNQYLVGNVRTMMDSGADKVFTSDGIGLPTQAREAVCFALLGAATLDGEPSNVPTATGASRRVVLGSVTPRP